ncbi:MAG: protoporphyrinogen oxidase, partial [Planctomycetota bacterium]
MNAIESLAIVGGGITGLSAAYYAKRANPQLEITVVEAADRLGGVVQTVHREGYCIEQSADSFLATPEMPWARQLVADLGLEDQLIGTRPEARRALVLFRRRLHPVPTGFNLMGTTKSFPIWRSSLLSWKGKWRLLQEPRVPKRSPADREESLAAFATRRVGQEAYERLVQPLSAGIYAADPTQLSVDAALPQFVEMEQAFGSLAKGLAQRNRDAPSVSGARYSKFLSLRKGLGPLVERLVTRLQDMGVKLETQLTVTQIDRPSRWRVSAGLKSQHADALILACPPKPIRAMIGGLDPTLAELLESIPSATLAIVCLAYERGQLETWPSASGFVVPAVESKGLIATSF